MFTLAGEPEHLWVQSDATGADLKLQVAALTTMHSSQVVLVGKHPLGDAELLSSHAPNHRLVGDEAAHTKISFQLVRRRCYSPGRLALSGSFDCSLKVWDLANGICIETLLGHTSYPQCVAVDWDSRRAVSISAHELKVWDLHIAWCIGTMAGDFGGFTGVCMNIDWTSMSALIGGGSLQIWNLDRAVCMANIPACRLGENDSVSCVAMEAGAQRAVSGHYRGTVKVWNLRQHSCICTLRGHEDKVCCVAVDWPSGRAVSGGRDYTLNVWDMNLGACTQSFLVSDPVRFKADWILYVALDWNAQRAMSCTLSGILKVWNLQDGSCEEASPQTLRSAANVVPEGQTIFCGCHSECIAIDWKSRHGFSNLGNGELKMWDLTSSRCALTLQGHTGPVTCVDISC